MKALLALEDGTVFHGKSLGVPGENAGEIVFNTSMTGYQEILTDPSYKGQIVTMTYPLIGNYGVNEEDVESARPHVEGFVVRECCKYPSSWRASQSLPAYLEENDIIGIEGVDTRALTRRIRTHGAMKAVISTEDLDTESLVTKAKESPGIIGIDLVKEVTCSEAYEFAAADSARYRVVAMDLGIKRNILRLLAAHDCRVTVVPAHTSAEQILAFDPDGVFLSNGPGDPEGVPYVIESVRQLIGKKPIFGICLGHQVLGLAFGAKSYKLKFGHHGGNQPIENLESGRVQITAENHCFGVDRDSLSESELEITHINLNDNTVEGMRHRRLSVLSIQYHPEASPGPHDSVYLFAEFVKMMAAAES